MIVPLILLRLGSVFSGYLASDAFIGWGNDLLALSAPASVDAVSSHMIPIWRSALPLITVPLGLLIAYVFLWPLPYCAESYWKKAYKFLQTRWGFDLVWNQKISINLLRLGEISWGSIDKGV